MGSRKLKVFYTEKVSAAAGSNLVPLPCGHYADVPRMRELIQRSLEKGLHSVPCSLCDGGRVPWQILRVVAGFTPDLLTPLEERLSVCSSQTGTLNKCPLCGRLVQRRWDKDQMVECPSCPGRSGNDHRFCWDCERDWGEAPAAGSRCPWADCRSAVLLHGCAAIERAGSRVHGCPSVRRCPRCSLLMQHQAGCERVRCPACGCRFCYRCLQTHASSSHPCTIQCNPAPGTAQSLQPLGPSSLC